jgi:hypothetical protein
MMMNIWLPRKHGSASSAGKQCKFEGKLVGASDAPTAWPPNVSNTGTEFRLKVGTRFRDWVFPWQDLRFSRRREWRWLSSGFYQTTRRYSPKDSHLGCSLGNNSAVTTTFAPRHTVVPRSSNSVLQSAWMCRSQNKRKQRSKIKREWEKRRG